MSNKLLRRVAIGDLREKRHAVTILMISQIAMAIIATPASQYCVKVPKFELSKARLKSENSSDSL